MRLVSAAIAMVFFGLTAPLLAVQQEQPPENYQLPAQNPPATAATPRIEPEKLTTPDNKKEADTPAAISSPLPSAKTGEKPKAEEAQEAKSSAIHSGKEIEAEPPASSIDDAKNYDSPAPIAPPPSPATSIAPKAKSESPSAIEGLISAVTMEMRIGIAVLFGLLILWKRRQKKKRVSSDATDDEPFQGDFSKLADIAAQDADVEDDAVDEAPLIRIEAKAVSLGRSFANVTLSYTLSITNLGENPIKNLGIEGEITSAHSNIPQEEQLAGRNTPLTPINDSALLAAGTTKQFRGELRMPINTIRIIMQGQAYLYIPLLRLRITGENIPAHARTYVVGRISQEASARLQPFRLDEMAQTYYEIGLRHIG